MGYMRLPTAKKNCKRSTKTKITKIKQKKKRKKYNFFYCKYNEVNLEKVKPTRDK